MTLYRLKPRFQRLLRPIARWIWERSGTANQVTIAAAAGSLLLGAVLALAGPRWPVLFLLLPVWLLARMALNAIDGMLAREFGQRSALGAYLNELCDPISDCALLLPLAQMAPFSPSWVVLVALLSVLTELAGALGPAVGASRRYDEPMGKSDRALALGVLGTALGLVQGLLGRELPGWISWSLPLLALLLLVTVVHRVYRGLIEAGQRPRLLSLHEPP